VLTLSLSNDQDTLNSHFLVFKMMQNTNNRGPYLSLECFATNVRMPIG